MHDTHLVHVQQVSPGGLVVDLGEHAAYAATTVVAVCHHVHGQREDGANLVVAQPHAMVGRHRGGGGGHVGRRGGARLLLHPRRGSHDGHGRRGRDTTF